MKLQVLSLLLCEGISAAAIKPIYDHAAKDLIDPFDVLEFDSKVVTQPKVHHHHHKAAQSLT